MSGDGPRRRARGSELPTLLANARAELSTCHDRLLARWASLIGVEALLSPLNQRPTTADVVTAWEELAGRVEEDHQLCSKILGQLHWASRVDSGTAGAPSLVTESVHMAITHAASLASCLEAAAHTLRTAGGGRGDLVEATSMCRRFLSAAQHDLDQVRADVDRAASLVPAPTSHWPLRAVI